MLDFTRFLILAHRGSSAHAQENTVEAFTLAAEQGAEGVELDVRRTADHELIVHHDALLDGRPLVAYTLAELKAAAPYVPTLAEAMTACQGMIVNVEIKNWSAEPDFDPDDRVATQTAAWLDENGWESQVLISSFNPQTIDVVKDGWPGMATAQLVGQDIDLVEMVPWIARRGHQAINPNWDSIGDLAGLVTAASSHSLWVLPWTVDDAAAIRRLADSGAAGVFTNDPVLARAAISPSG